MTHLATITINSWRGVLPRRGEYLKTEKGRTAFLVVGILEPARPAARYVCRLVGLRERPDELPDGAVIHPFAWAPRRRTRPLQSTTLERRR